MSDSGSEADVWDVEKYRVDYESEEHWELRKVSNMKQTRKYLKQISSGFHGSSSR